MHDYTGWDNLSLFDEPSQEDLDMPMSDIERSELAEHEQVIESGLETFRQVGVALLAIRDKLLYRETHTTWEEYCRDRWGMSDRHARRLISATKAVDVLVSGPNGSENVPYSERQIRPLTNLPPDQQREAWQRAVDTAPGGNVTAGHVQRIVDEMRGKTPPVDTEDDYDPDEAWEQRKYHGSLAYCKYCYETHDRWELSGDHDDFVWRCGNCGGFTADENMQLEDAPPVERPKTATQLRQEYLEAARREGIKADTKPNNLVMNDAELFEYLPSAKEFVTDVNRLIRWLQLEFPAAVDIGKLSPEAERYLAGRLDILIRVASERRDELGNTDD